MLTVLSKYCEIWEQGDLSFDIAGPMVRDARNVFELSAPLALGLLLAQQFKEIPSLFLLRLYSVVAAMKTS
jgi:hypothetical protein